ncbi:MAG: YbaK/EbsC family protein [Spirochaetales bacterium]|nr:YbaK/EbsC family protein [Spirochaetales bacterium]
MSYELAFGYLKERGFADRVKVFEGVGTTENCLLASQALGVGVGDICKSMIFHDRDDSSAIMVLAAGDVKFNNGKFKRTFGLKPSMLSAEETERFTNHRIGGVCPFGIGENVKVYADESLKRFETVFPACGSDNSAVKLSVDELFSLSGALGWVDVTVPRSE